MTDNALSCVLPMYVCIREEGTGGEEEEEEEEGGGKGRGGRMGERTHQ